MNLSTAASRIRQHIGQADTAGALQTLIDFLQQSPRHKAFHDAALNVQALFQRTRLHEMKGAITHEQASANYNLVNDSVLQLLGQLEQGLKAPQGLDQKIRSYRFQNWQLTLTGIAALGILALVYLLLPKNEIPALPQCPPFPETTKLNVLLLPFLNLSDGGLKPEYAIKDRLEKYARDYRLSAQVKVYDAYFQLPGAEVPDFDLAGQVGAECQAGLIIWGAVERLSTGRIDISSKFKFIGQEEFFALRKLRLEGETQIDTALSISSISRQGDITRDIEDIVLTLFGLAAHEQGAHEAAIAALRQTQAAQGRDSANVLLTQTILADSYLATNQAEKALESYDRVIEVHPDYNLARNNRGLLLLRTAKPEAAAEDFSNIISRHPDNTEALIGRAAAYTEMKETLKARKDIDRVRIIDPDAKLPILRRQ
jgi:tetratricopeptide (TPR) repeat protein